MANQVHGPVAKATVTRSMAKATARSGAHYHGPQIMEKVMARTMDMVCASSATASCPSPPCPPQPKNNILEVRVQVIGAYALFGLKIDRVTGDTINSKIATVTSWSPRELMDACDRGDGFKVVVQAGDVYALPAGYLIMTFTPSRESEIVGLRWSCLPEVAYTDVNTNIGLLLQSQEHLKDTDYKALKETIAAALLD